MMALLEDIPLKITKTDKGLMVEAKGKNIEIDTQRPIISQVSKSLSIRHRMGQWLPPKAFKDWNDCLLNKPMVPIISATKSDRDSNLAEQRKSSMKL